MKLDLLILFFILIWSFIISIIISITSFVLSDKSPDKEKVSVYECGFDPFHNPGEPFSIRFFLIAILFLIFDLEISYLFPWSISTSFLNLRTQIIIYIFLIILTLGLIYEWIKGGLEWE